MTSIVDSYRINADMFPEATRKKLTLMDVKYLIDTRLNNALCDMKQGEDDSIVGFNEAWDIVRRTFNEVIP